MPRVHLPCLTEGPPHLLDDLHLFECSAQSVCGGAYRIHYGVRRHGGRGTSVLTGGARRFSRVASSLLLLSESFESLATAIALFPALAQRAS